MTVGADKPFFSVVVPVYNTEKYLKQCIQSILEQKFENFEIVAVDDGSPDNSGSILDRYAEADSRMHVIHKKNGGLVSARKAGTAKCKGQYILNVDSDDYIHKDLFSELYTIAESNGFPDIITFDYLHFDSDSEETFHCAYESGLYKDEKLKRISDNIIYDKNLDNINMSGMAYSIWSKAVKRELLQMAQPMVPDEISMGEDLAVSAYILTHCESLFISHFEGYYYRKNPQSMVNTFNSSGIYKTEILCDYLESILDKKYKNNIHVYSVSCCQRYIFAAAKHFVDYREFADCLNKNIGQKLHLHNLKAKVSKPDYKERIFLIALKLKFWKFLWKVYKKRIAANENS